MTDETQSCVVVIDENNQKPPLTASYDELKRMLHVIRDDILPKTRVGVANGNKVFGAAVLENRTTMKTIVADTNNELICPMFHGEVHVIYQWSKIVPPSQRGKASQEAVFLATHEPCCMCISSILWSGFATCYYLFPYSVTSAQGIPYDINTMHELWNVPTYRKQNKYLSTACIMDLVNELSNDSERNELLDLQTELINEYNALANQYHTEKVNNVNNTLVLG